MVQQREAARGKGGNVSSGTFQLFLYESIDTFFAEDAFIRHLFLTFL